MASRSPAQDGGSNLDPWESDPWETDDAAPEFKPGGEILKSLGAIATHLPEAIPIAGPVLESYIRKISGVKKLREEEPLASGVGTGAALLTQFAAPVSALPKMAALSRSRPVLAALAKMGVGAGTAAAEGFISAPLGEDSLQGRLSAAANPYALGGGATAGLLGALGDVSKGKAYRAAWLATSPSKGVQELDAATGGEYGIEAGKAILDGGLLSGWLPPRRKTMLSRTQSKLQEIGQEIEKRVGDLPSEAGMTPLEIAAETERRAAAHLPSAGNIGRGKGAALLGAATDEIKQAPVVINERLFAEATQFAEEMVAREAAEYAKRGLHFSADMADEVRERAVEQFKLRNAKVSPHRMFEIKKRSQEEIFRKGGYDLGPEERAALNAQLAVERAHQQTLAAGLRKAGGEELGGLMDSYGGLKTAEKALIKSTGNAGPVNKWGIALDYAAPATMAAGLGAGLLGVDDKVALPMIGAGAGGALLRSLGPQGYAKLLQYLSKRSSSAAKFGAAGGEIGRLIDQSEEGAQ